ncbi:hypothetical protein GCT13_45705 [Paraburkholderia sp. CNPSo 3157]|uniref:Uncharacterized protein n=1 Tax=Paraburkholderia franconis TaxID=2654983 RepID=A0A7X1NKV4_9BURK|nr:hypothetical protein [Paraburkholderia franconis]MPW23795.1 hypothetical protein [Paraburkholderia franconis]
MRGKQMMRADSIAQDKSGPHTANASRLCTQVRLRLSRILLYEHPFQDLGAATADLELASHFGLVSGVRIPGTRQAFDRIAFVGNYKAGVIWYMGVPRALGFHYQYIQNNRVLRDDYAQYVMPAGQCKFSLSTFVCVKRPGYAQ